MPTNAQTALTAAATLHEGAGGYAHTADILRRATEFHAWLKARDEEVIANAEPPEPEQRDTTLDAMVERSESTAPPELHRDYREEPMYRARPIGFGR